MLKECIVFIEYYILENNKIEAAFRLKNVVMPFSKLGICKINICCPEEVCLLAIRWNGFHSSINFFNIVILLLHFLVTNYLNKSVITSFFKTISSKFNNFFIFDFSILYKNI